MLNNPLSLVSDELYDVGIRKGDEKLRSFLNARLREIVDMATGIGPTVLPGHRHAPADHRCDPQLGTPARQRPRSRGQRLANADLDWGGRSAGVNATRPSSVLFHPNGRVRRSEGSMSVPPSFVVAKAGPARSRPDCGRCPRAITSSSRPCTIGGSRSTGLTQY